MELIPIECGNCKAKLKIKAMPARMPTEVKCPKCGKPIPVGKGAPVASAPIASAPVAPVSAPVAPVPAAPVPPPPMAAPIPAPPAAASSTAQLTPPPKPMQPPSAPPVSSVKKAAAPIVLGQVPDASSGTNISVVCPSCQWQTKVSQTLIGKKIKCKQCSGIIPVSSPEQPKTAEEVIAPEVVTTVEPTVSIEPDAPVAIEAPIPSTPIPEPVAEPVITRLRPEPVEPIIPVAKWTEPEVILNGPLASSRVSPGTTVILGEISSLKSRLETATRESALSIKRAEEADTKVRDAEAKVQYAEQRVKEAERTLHELAGKSAIDAMTANRRISDLESKLAPLEAKIAALNQSLTAVTDEFASELEHAEKTAARLKALLSSHHSLRSS